MKAGSFIIQFFFVVILTVMSGSRVFYLFEADSAVAGPYANAVTEDVMEKTIILANQLNKEQPATKWETIIDSEGADFITFLDNERLLVGTVESGGHLGVPSHKDIILMKASTGEKIWSAAREGLGNGQYFLLLTEPFILMMGKNDRSTFFTAYNPVNGSKAWNYSIKKSGQFMLTDSLDRFIFLYADGDDKKLDALDLQTGKILWSQHLSSESSSKEKTDYLFSSNKFIFVVTEKIYKIASEDGQIQWEKEYPVLAERDRSHAFTPEGILIYNSERMTFISGQDGSVLWDLPYGENWIDFAAFLEDKIYRVTVLKSEGDKETQTIVQALNPENGLEIWSIQIPGRVASPLFVKEGILTFTTNEALYGFRTDTGDGLYLGSLSEEFIARCPDSAKIVKRPDEIRFRSGRLYLVREMAGISVYEFPAGEKLWEQLNFDYQKGGYSAGRFYYALLIDQLRQVPGSNLSSVQTSNANSENVFLRSAQREYEYMRQRTSAVLSDRTSTREERQSAIQERATQSGLMQSRMKIDMAIGQMQAAADFAMAVAGLGEAIKKVLEITAMKGMIAREYMEFNSILALPQLRFQSNYYLWPFYEEGRGLTLVDLDTGMRNDLISSPHIDPLGLFGLNLPSFCIGPDGKTLVLVGVGLNPSRYQRYSKWKYSFPKSSVLAYDISTFDFQERSLTQKKVEVLADEMKLILEASKIHTAAQYGNLEVVKSLLDSGVDVNTKHPNDTCGPLVFAIIGKHVEIVKLLIDRGADFNDHTIEGKSVLYYATHFGNDEIVKLLKNAGAK